MGVQQSFKRKLKDRIKNLEQKTSSDALFRKVSTVRVKLTYIGPWQHIVTFGFTILDEGSAAKSFARNHTVCIVRGPCTCPKADIHRVDQEWSLTDQNKGARTIQSITDASRLPARSKKKFNCSKVPLFSMVPMEGVIIDNLHLFLRVADNLINLLILDLRRLAGIEKCNELDRSKATNIREYEAFLVFSCKDSRFLK